MCKIYVFGLLAAFSTAAFSAGNDPKKIEWVGNGALVAVLEEANLAGFSLHGVSSARSIAPLRSVCKGSFWIQDESPRDEMPGQITRKSADLRCVVSQRLSDTHGWARLDWQSWSFRVVSLDDTLRLADEDLARQLFEGLEKAAAKPFISAYVEDQTAEVSDEESWRRLSLKTHPNVASPRYLVCKRRTVEGDVTHDCWLLHAYRNHGIEQPSPW